MISGIDTSNKPDLADFPSAKAQNSAPLDFVRPKKVRRFRLLRLIIGLAIFLGLLAAIVIGAGYYVLSQGSISSERLRTEAETQLATLLGDNRSARIGEAKFAVGHNGLIAIDATNVRILENETTNLGIASAVSVNIRALPLLSGKVVAEKITLDGGQFALAPFLSDKPQPDAEALSTSNEMLFPDPEQLSVDRFLRSLASTFARAAEAIEKGGLDALFVKNTEIVDFSKLGLRTQKARLVSFSLERNLRFQEGLFFKALLETARSNISFSGQWRTLDDGGALFTLDGRGLDIVEFTAQGDSAYVAAKAPLEFRFAAPFSSAGAPQQATLQMLLGAGNVRIDKELNSQFRGANVNLRLMPENNQIELERSPFVFDHIRTELIGGLRFPEGNEELGGRAIFELIANDTVATAYDDKQRPGQAAIRIGGHFENDWRTLRADKINIKMTSGELRGRGVIDDQPGGTAVSLLLETTKLSVDEFKQFWPPMIATGARRWAFDGLSGGEMRNAKVALDFPAGSLGRVGEKEKLTVLQLSADVPLVGATVKTLGALPPLLNASGTLLQRGMDTIVDIESADMKLPSGRKITIKPSKLAIDDFSLDAQPTRAELALTGSAQAMLELGTKQPLAFTKALNLSSSEVKGSISGDVKLETVLLEGGRFGKVDWKVEAQAKEFSSTQPIEGTRFENANVTIKAQPGSARIDGTARVNGIQADIAMVENFGPGAKSGQRSVTLSLNDAEREKLGIVTGGLLSGRTDVSIGSKGTGVQSLDIDLRQAKLELPWIGWSKGKGIGATASFDLQSQGKTRTLRNFKLRGKGFRADGTIVADRNGLVRADMKNVRLNGTDDLDVVVERVKGGYDVRLNARAYDGRAIIRALMNDNQSTRQTAGGLRVRVRGEISKLIGFQKQTLTGLSVDYTQENGRVRKADVSALAPGGAPTRFIIEPGANGMVTRLVGENAGSILRFLDIYSKVRGGTISVDLTDNGSGRRRGTVIAKNFTLLDEPRLGALLKPPGRIPNSRLDGERAVREIIKVDPNRVLVDDVFARIEMRPKTLVVRKGRLKGGDAGAAFEGLVYDANNRTDLRGTFLPAYGLNNFVSKIPIIGLAFGSGRSSGLIGITFRLRGAYSNPQLIVNPISILTPGVFRKLFEF
ncbi:DUF3971 domain-containing protein [Pseudahrensia aquimaris]|uniref:DUF3971 domain-containing protein n=1 Tax=Pseudahrensia aquimaris TaxID=744461 RepID=A0ABW3FCI9_9HYPH